MLTRPRPLLGLILLASLAVRAWYWLQVHGTHLLSVPYLDAHDYHAWARALVAGDWGRGEPYWMGPLYPHLLAISYAVFGPDGLAMVAAQWALTLLNIWLVWRLGRRWLGDGGGLLAAALYAGYGPPVFYAGLRLMVTVVTTLMLLVAWQADRARTAGSRAGPWLVLGLLVGLTATARGNVLVLLPLLPLVLLRLSRIHL